MLIGIVVLFVLAPSILAKEQRCGGLLEGDNGKFRYKTQAAEDEQNPQSCALILQAYGATQIKLTLDEFLPGGDNNALIFYPDTAPGATDLNPITLDAQSVGSTLTLHGSTVIIILPQSSSSLAFTWSSTPANILTEDDSVTIADYIQVPDGELTWTPGRKQEKLWWVVGAGASAVVEWKIQVDLSDCDKNHLCPCLGFKAYELGSDGNLLEVARVCGRSSSGVFEMQSSQLVVAASANATQPGGSTVTLHWMGDQGVSTTNATTTSTTTTTLTSTTTTTTTAPPEKASLYFATNRRGVSAYSLETNKTKKIVNSTENLQGITYDSIQNKLYFSTDGKIYRSNKDGTEVEIVLGTDLFKAIFIVQIALNP